MRATGSARRLGRWMVPIATLAVIAVIAYYLYANSGKFLPLLNVSIASVAILALFSAVFPVLNGLINVHMFRALGARLSHREAILLAASASLANQLPVPGGVVAKGVYLKYKYDMSYSKYFSATLAFFVCALSVNGLIAEAVLLKWALLDRAAVSPLLLTIFGVMAASAAVFWLPVRRIRGPQRFQGWMDQAGKGWVLISRNPALLFRLLALQASLMLVFALKYWMAFRMLSQPITPGQVLLLSSASILTQLVSLAPGGLGVQEAIVGGIASVLGFDLTVSLAAVELDRVVQTSVTVLAGWMSTILLGRHMSASSPSAGGPKL